MKESSLVDLYESFSPASRAVILFAIPFTVVDAVHYFTAGTVLAFSFPLLALIYLLCGGLAAKIAHQDAQDAHILPGVGRTAGLRLWLTSTSINILISVLVGFTTLGVTWMSGAVYLCLFAPFHAIGSALIGWCGGWLYQQFIKRTNTNQINT